jgi:hypothetical protein
VAAHARVYAGQPGYSALLNTGVTDHARDFLRDVRFVWKLDWLDRLVAHSKEMPYRFTG